MNPRRATKPCRCPARFVPCAGVELGGDCDWDEDEIDEVEGFAPPLSLTDAELANVEAAFRSLNPLPAEPLAAGPEDAPF